MVIDLWRLQLGKGRRDKTSALLSESKGEAVRKVATTVVGESAWTCEGAALRLVWGNPHHRVMLESPISKKPNPVNAREM